MKTIALLTAALATALVASACASGPEEHFVIDYEERALGVGLEYTFRPMRIVCEPHQQFPYACHQRFATVDRVSASGAGEIRETLAKQFTVYGREAGTASIDLHATLREDDGVEQSLADTFEIRVLSIAYSQLAWYNGDVITEQNGAAFHSSTVQLSQSHYREPRESLLGALPSRIIAAELDGRAALELDRGTTSAALDGGSIATGETLGTATVRTTAGGAFLLDIVDESSIARLEIERENQYANLGSIVVKPFDAADRPITGCPSRRGPTISDTAGAVRVAAIETTPWLRWCEVKLEWVQSPRDTTIVVQWGGREARIAVDPS